MYRWWYGYCHVCGTRITTLLRFWLSANVTDKILEQSGSFFIRVYKSSISVLFTALFATYAVGQDIERPTVDENGTIHGALTTAPMPSFLSEDIKTEFTTRLRAAKPPSLKDGLEAVRY